MKFSKKKKKSLKKFNLVAHFCYWHFLKTSILKHFLLKLCPFFVSWFWSFGKKYENDLDVIFDHWPKLSLALDVRPEIPILKGLYWVGIRGWIFHTKQSLALLRSSQNMWIFYIKNESNCPENYCHFMILKHN